MADPLVAEAEAVYRGVVTDPKRYGPGAADVVERARRARQHEALVVALRAQAWAARADLADLHAKSLLDEAARVARRHSLSQRLVEVLTSRGAVNLELGRIPAARRDLARAQTLSQGRRLAALLLQQAVLLHNIGHLNDAGSLYRQVLDDPDADVATRATSANNLAIIEIGHSRPDHAAAALGVAATAAAAAGPALVALVAQTEAWVLVQAGRVTEGMARFDAAAVLYAEAGLPLAEHYVEYVDALADLRLVPEALATSRRAVAAHDGADVPLMAAEARLRLARLALMSGDSDQAVEIAAEAGRMFRAQRRPAWAAQADVVAVRARADLAPPTTRDLAMLRRAAATLSGRAMPSATEAHLEAGRMAARLGRDEIALHHFDEAWASARTAPVLQRLMGRVAAALSASLRGQDTATLRQCRAGLNDLAVHRATLQSSELRALASGHGAELGTVALRVVLRRGSAAPVLDWMERTRAASMVATESPPAADDDGLAALRTAQAELARVQSTGGGAPAALLSSVTELEHRARRASWSLPGTDDAGPPALRATDLRTALAGRVLVEFAALDGALAVVVLDRQRTRLVRLGSPDAAERETRALLFALRRLATAGPFTSPAATAMARSGAEVALSMLRQLLIEPLRLPVDAELVVVPSAILWPVPWSALHEGPVTVSPSATLWVRTQGAGASAARRTGAARTVLVAGPDLPGAVDEVESLRGVHREATVLLPPASSVAEVAAALADADLAHLACHSGLRADNPAFSSLLLSDGPLSVHEIDLRGLAPRRVVLAACDSAADVAYEGNEMLGFVSALLARGTTALAASVVPVPDVDAVSLMRCLHEQLAAGASMSHALHRARATLDLTDHRSFVNWCAFSAFGAG